jgi:SAM-dependent methyltransferase
MSNSEIYGNQEALNYYDRNLNHGVSFFSKYLLELFPHCNFAGSKIAEFGIGNGANLFFLSEFAQVCHGYEIGQNAVDHVNDMALVHHHGNKIQAVQANLSRPFSPITQYDLIIFGFFAYYCDDHEMAGVMENTLRCLAPGGAVFVSDFGCRKNIVKSDSRNPALNVYKRNIDWWRNFFKNFDLIDYRLFDASKLTQYSQSDAISKWDLSVSENDDNWLFGSLFKMRRV